MDPQLVNAAIIAGGSFILGWICCACAITLHHHPPRGH